MNPTRKLTTKFQTRIEGSSHSTSNSRETTKATFQDEIARKRQGFCEVEATLPRNIGTNETNFLDRVMTFAFGNKNPMAREADTETDIIWLFDNTAYQPDSSVGASWEAEFISAYFVKNSGGNLNSAVSDIADKIGVDDGHLGNKESAQQTIEKRLRPFTLNILPARYTYVSVPGDEVHQFGPGNRSGISIQTIRNLGSWDDGNVAQSFSTKKSLTPYETMLTNFVGPYGWTVISDIDDSIKTTMTSSPIGILQSTFYDDPMPIEGMPELYRQIDKLLTPNWFYLSASPYTLYTFLRPFVRQYYPHGTLILRDASWQDLNGLLQSFTVGTAAYKSGRIEKIHSWLPHRKILCVGDSTQSDPEAYGSMYRRFPGWIKAIFIRKVTGVKGIDVTTKNTPERFEEAFKDIPRSSWRVFEDPYELKQVVQSLKTL